MIFFVNDKCLLFQGLPMMYYSLNYSTRAPGNDILDWALFHAHGLGRLFEGLEFSERRPYKNQ